MKSDCLYIGLYSTKYWNDPSKIEALCEKALLPGAAPCMFNVTFTCVLYRRKVITRA